MRLDDALLERAKREAGRRGTTLTALLEEGLQLALARSGHSTQVSCVPAGFEGAGWKLTGSRFGRHLGSARCHGRTSLILTDVNVLLYAFKHPRSYPL